MTNLLIAYPDIPWRAVASNSSTTWADLTGYRNGIFGERWTVAKTTAYPTSFNVEFDLGAGVTSGIDYLIIAKASRLQGASADTLTLDSSTALGGSYTTRWTNSTFDTATLYGPGSDDYIVTGLGLGAYRSWRVSFSGIASTQVLSYSKIYFGNAWNPGRDPDYTYKRIPARAATTYTYSGAQQYERLEKAIYKFDFRWRGVTDALAKTFSDNIERYKHRHRYFLYTTGNHYILDSQRIVHVKLVSSDVAKDERVPNRNTISATFEEVLG